MEHTTGLARRGLAQMRVGPAIKAPMPCVRKVIPLPRTVCAALETTVAEEPAAKADDPKRGPSGRKAAKDVDRSARNGKDSGENSKKNTGLDANGRSSFLSSADRALIKERTKLLLEGQAVGLSMLPTPVDLATGMKGLKPLSQELQRKDHTLLFFPSTESPQQGGEEKEKEASPDAQAGESAVADAAKSGNGEPQRRQRRQEQPKASEDSKPDTQALSLAMVAVPRFEAPTPEVTIRVGAKSDVGTISRILTRALLRSSSVAVQCAGPAAALVAMRAAVQSRRALAYQEQLDLAFSIEYLSVAATEASKTPADASVVVIQADAAAAPADGAPAAAAAAADAAPAPAAAAEAAGAEAAEAAPAPAVQSAPASVLQFSFYKRALPTPEVLVSEFAPSRSTFALAEVIIRLMGERREVDLVVSSRDTLFLMQSLTRVINGCWVRYNASVGAFLTSLEEEAPDAPPTTTTTATASSPDSTPASGDSSAGADAGTGDKGPEVKEQEQEKGKPPLQPRFTARLQLRRIPGAPNLVAASGFGDFRQSLLGAPLGTVAWNTRIPALASAITRELAAVGVFSVLPSEGVCVARALAALWEAQRKRVETAARAAAADQSAEGAAEAAAPPSPPPIAIVPELQYEGSGGAAIGPAGGQEQDRRRGDEATDASAPGARGPPRATVLHMLEVTPVLAKTLRVKSGTKVAVADGKQLLQFIKAVLLRNRMYGNRRGGKLLVIEPFLDSSRALNLLFEYVDTSLLENIPLPPAAEKVAVAGGRAKTPRRAARGPATDGYATDDEFGVGAEAAVLVPTAPAAAAKAAAKATAAASEAGKSAWVLQANAATNTQVLAMDIVAETTKAYDRLSPAWVRVMCWPASLANAFVGVAQAQLQVQERAEVQLQVLPVLDKMRDDQNRPVNGLTLRLLKSGPGAEPGAAARTAAKWKAEQAAAETAPAAPQDAKKRRPGPSPAAMAAAAAAAAKLVAQDDALMAGTRKMW